MNMELIPGERTREIKCGPENCKVLDSQRKQGSVLSIGRRGQNH